MNVDLAEKVLVVTGGTQGVGAKVAALAAGSGAAGILITGRDAGRGRAVVASLAEHGSLVEFAQADLADADAPDLILDAAMEAFGRIDLLVNAAGLTDRAGLLDGQLEDWDRLFAVNARAPFFLMQGAVRDMRSRDAPGAIVNILSVNSHCGAPDLAIYSATKGALATLTRNAANAHLADRIRVNGINMGWADTPGERVMQGKILGKGDDWLRQAAAEMPLKRLLTDDEVAQLTIFLLSDMSGLMTGALIDLEQVVLGAPARAKAG